VVVSGIQKQKSLTMHVPFKTSAYIKSAAATFAKQITYPRPESVWKVTIKRHQNREIFKNGQSYRQTT
jgi:hypothetical protein